MGFCRILFCYRYLVLACLVLAATVITEYFLFTSRSRFPSDNNAEGGATLSASLQLPRSIGLLDVADPDLWRRYEMIDGMTKEQVKAILGVPISIAVLPGHGEWHFWAGRGGDRCVVWFCNFADYKAYLLRGETTITWKIVSGQSLTSHRAILQGPAVRPELVPRTRQNGRKVGGVTHEN
jgi:hypothetical protein